MEIFNNVKQNIANFQGTKDTSGTSSSSQQVSMQNSTVEQTKQQEQQKNVDELKKQLAAITNELNQQMAMMDTSIRFGFNDKSDAMYVNVVDSKTDKVIRKIPTDEMMTLQEAMRDMIGVIFDKKA